VRNVWLNTSAMMRGCQVPLLIDTPQATITVRFTAPLPTKTYPTTNIQTPMRMCCVCTLRAFTMVWDKVGFNHKFNNYGVSQV
jgi:hypothetical protein